MKSELTGTNVNYQIEDIFCNICSLTEIETMSLSDKPSMSEIASKVQPVIARVEKKCHKSGMADTNNVSICQSKN